MQYIQETRIRSSTKPLLSSFMEKISVGREYLGDDLSGTTPLEAAQQVLP